jgi:hypothetical protein
MDIEDARTATPLVAAIDARTEKIALLQQALNGEGYFVTKMEMITPTNQTISMLLGQLDAPTSAACFTFALGIYESQKDDLLAELAAI